ncbi:PREDICTED: Down syndrome cell adhesion molecule homolog, partial [Amphimedon queenslandica]|uniref:Ig-like domain-containing protein n=1 Tax=Amphimedon queenslandica TaxID=400682 RepID=A0AAN0JZL3_AMPQE
PNEINSTASIIPLNVYYEVDSNITLSCSISYHKPSYIDMDTVVNISWINNEDDILNSSTIDIEDYTEHNFQYHLTNFSLSNAGQYKCSNTHHTQQEYKFIQSSESQYKYTNITAIIPIDNTALEFKPTEPYYEVGSDVILSCKVTEPNSPLVNVDTTVNIKWSCNRNLSQQYSIYPYNKYFNHTLTNIKLSDAGEYNCTYYLNSTTDNPYIIPSDARTGVTNVTIKIPNDKVPVINLIPHQSVYDAGSDITLSCSVTYPYSSFIDVDTNLTLQWFNSSNHTLNFSTIINDNNEHTLTYTISNARLSDAGLYACSFFINTSVSHIVTSNATRNFTIINIKMPNVITPYILVHPSKSYYNVNDNITLSCIISYPTNHLIDVNTTVTIQWHHYGLDRLNSYTEVNDKAQHSFSYTIGNARLSDAGQYTCSFFVNATNNNDVIRSKINYNFTSITVKIPNGKNPSVNQLKPYYSVGDSITLTCTATYPSHITTNLNIQWLNSSNHTLHSYTGINNNTEHTISYTINNVSLSDAGQYTCQYSISSTNHSFVLPSDNIRTSVNVTVN